MKTLSILFFSLCFFCFSSLSFAALHRSAKKSHHPHHQHHSMIGRHKGHHHHSHHHAKRTHTHGTHKKVGQTEKLQHPNRFIAQELPAKLEINHSNDLAEITGPDPFDLRGSARSQTNTDEREYYNVKPNSQDKKLNPVSRKHLPYERVQYGYSTSTPDIHRSASLSED